MNENEEKWTSCVRPPKEWIVELNTTEWGFTKKKNDNPFSYYI